MKIKPKDNFTVGKIIGKDPDAGTDWGQEEKGTTKDERHH